MSRKYPDANINNPLKEEAKKFKEAAAYCSRSWMSVPVDILRAGEAVRIWRCIKSAENMPGQRTASNGRAAANYIQSGHYTEAPNVLSSIKERGALWYFYSASANSGAGNNDGARTCKRSSPAGAAEHAVSDARMGCRAAEAGISRDRGCMDIQVL